jgi:hypothetical protein
MLKLARQAEEVLAKPVIAKAVERVAEALLNKPTLTGRALERLLETVPPVTRRPSSSQPRR